MDQQHTTGHPCGRCHGLLGEEQNVGVVFWFGVSHFPWEAQLGIDLDRGVIAADLRSGLHLAVDVAVAVGTGQMVPHHFQAILRNRERVIVGLLEVLQGITVSRCLGDQRAYPGGVINSLGRCGGALGLVHRDLVAVRVTFEHRQLAGAQFAFILFGIGCSDGEQRLVTFEGIAEKVVLQWGGIGLEATGPGRDAAIGVARFLTTKGGQTRTQLVGFLLRNSRHHAAGHQGQCQCADR
ncbi:hypothetical protein D3C84_739130 [compost metagenome]